MQSAVAPKLSRFGATVLEPKILRWLADAETHPPRAYSWNIWGKRADELITSEGWRKLQSLGIAEGMVAIPYENRYAEYSRVHQFLKYHLWTGSCAYVTCPSAMTDGAARLLTQHIQSSATISRQEKAVFRQAYDRLVSTDVERAWTSGQWMTERVGGSDVRSIETMATRSPAANSDGPEPSETDADGAPLGPWLINGFKWFSSATDANMTILLAKTPDGGISAFYAPTRRAVRSFSSPNHAAEAAYNGIEIQRLKSKLGTRALPTAELDLKNVRAYMIGKQGEGTKKISIVLNITRVHNAVTACGLLGRGLAIARSFARVRSVKGQLLRGMPAYMRTMADLHLEYRGHMHLTFFVVALLGVSEQSSKGIKQSSNHSMSEFVPRERYVVKSLLRVLTPIVKALSAKAAIAGLAECMECLGGVGYVDSCSPSDIGTNVARLYRDANVLSIWEGTTNVMAEDTIRVLKGKNGAEVLHALDCWVNARLASMKMEGEQLEASNKYLVRESWSEISAKVMKMDIEQLTVHGRNLMTELAWTVISILLMEDARINDDELTRLVAQRWTNKRRQIGFGDEAMDISTRQDQQIIYGDEQDFVDDVVTSKL